MSCLILVLIPWEVVKGIIWEVQVGCQGAGISLEFEDMGDYENVTLKWHCRELFCIR